MSKDNNVSDSDFWNKCFKVQYYTDVNEKTM